MKESLLSKYVTNCSLNCHQRCHFKTGQLSSWLSSWGVISCQNWNVWACDWLANARLHLAPSVSTGLLMATITFPLSLHSTLYLLTITILPPANEWSNGQASPSTCTTSSTKKSQSENSLKSKYEAKNKTLTADTFKICSLATCFYLILTDLFLYLRAFSLFKPTQSVASWPPLTNKILFFW